MPERHFYNLVKLSSTAAFYKASTHQNLERFQTNLCTRNYSKNICKPGCDLTLPITIYTEPSGHAVHEEFDGLDSEGQHGQPFITLRHTHKQQKWPYHICVIRSENALSRSENVRHRCGGG